MTSTKAKAVHFRSSGRSNWRITFITKGVALLYQDLDVQVEAEETKITGLSAQKGSRSERLVTIWQGFVDRGFSVKMLQNGLGLRATDDRGQRGRVSLLHRLQAAEVLQQTSRGLRANSRDIQKFCLVVAHLAALAMEGHRETMRFVAHQLHQVQHRRVTVEHDRIVLLAVHVDNLFALGNRR